MNFMEQREALAKEAENLVEKARSEKGLTDSEREQLAQLKSDALDLQKMIQDSADADSLLKSLGKPATEHEKQKARNTVAKSLGEHVVMNAKDAFTDIKGRRRIQADVPEFDAKAAGDVVVTGNAFGSAESMLTPDIDRNIVHVVEQRPTIASWLGAGTIASNAITYFVEQPWDDAAYGQFKTVGENARKPGMTPPTYKEVTETLKKIAGWIKLSMEMAEDASFLVSEINNRLLFQLTMFEEEQLLNGDGTGTNVKGLLLREGVQVATSASAANNMDSIYKAINAVFLKTNLRADGIVINPADYEKLRLLKDGNGQYFAGGPFTGQYNNGGILQDPPIWGLQTIQTTAVDAGTVLIGAGKQGATVYRKGGIRVETSNVDGEDFTHNRFTILAEERLTLAVRRPDAFVKLTLA